MFLIYIPKETNRLLYTIDYLFSEVIRIPFKYTLDKEEFLKSDNPQISYGKHRVADEFFIPGTDLLFETSINKKNIDVKTKNNSPVFFEVEEGDLPFDLFAAVFYLISRYEEYLPHATDKHGRFTPEGSVAFKGGFLEKPLVNIWAKQLKESLTVKFPGVKFPEPEFVFTPSIDIDNAYAYKYKGIGRAGFGLASKLLSFQFKKFSRRVAVYAGYKRDPYDSYEKQERIHKAYKVLPLYFILLGDFGKYDRNLSHNNKYMVKLIKRLSENGFVGVHPSYESSVSETQLGREKHRLENIIGKKVVKSRQHYIKLKMPDTYRNLINAGILEDYSMGYPSRTGFRASTATPFKFFDLEKNITTDLKVYPFVAMDSTLKFYSRFKSKEVVPHLRPIVNEVKKVGGHFIFVFHNESIGGSRIWKNWGDMYEKLIKLSLE